MPRAAAAMPFFPVTKSGITVAVPMMGRCRAGICFSQNICDISPV